MSPDVCAGRFDTDPGGVIVRADPQVHMSDRILFQEIIYRTLPGWTIEMGIIGASRTNPFVPGMLTPEEYPGQPLHERGIDMTGAVLRITNSAGPDVVYRIEGRCPHGDWLLRWPD